MTSYTPIKLLWTGGWDSTFRLLDLVLHHKVKVQPYYVVDPKRPSHEIEQQTMQSLRLALHDHDPETKTLLLPTIVLQRNNILPDKEITDAFEIVKAKSFIGPQYDWLSRLCKQNQISDIEICVDLDERPHFAIDNYTVIESYPTQNTYIINKNIADIAHYTIFQYFIFPVLSLTKLDMKKIADQNGWSQLMGKTWFCHFPDKHNRPCGQCNPCRVTISEGLAYRIPLANRIKFYLNKIRTKLSV